MPLKEEFHYIFQEEEACEATQGHRGKHQVWSGVSENKEKAQPRDFPVFSMGKARQGRGNSLGLASLSNVGGLWAIRVVSGCLVTGPGQFRAGCARVRYRRWLDK